MSGISCDMCGAKLRVEITGGRFYIREGSTLDDLNFEKVEDTKIITLDELNKGSIDEDTSLTVDVICTTDRDHPIFAHTISKIKCEVYARIMAAAHTFMNKHNG